MEFIQKVQTPDLIEVVIKKVFDEKTSEWQGKKSFYKNCVIEWNGSEYYAKFSQKYYPIAIEGNKVTGTREVINGYPFFKWFSGGDGMTPNPGLEPPMPTSPIVNEVPTYLNKRDPVEVPLKPKEKVKDDAYWEEVNKGKVRHGVACAVIESHGLESINEMKPLMNKCVDYIMNGQ